ncbi:MAG: OsmC family protein [Bacteroidales bacterium]|nr:OsmC family protein [Bacteroidales bacterium]
MITAHTKYLGDLRTLARHIRSGNEIITDAPPDNQGKGEAFSPTDLLATALGSCMLTIIGIAAQTHGIDIEGTEVEITKYMLSDPRRVGKVELDFFFPKEYSPREQSIIEKSGRTCPVALSLHPDLKQDIRFHYGGRRMDHHNVERIES